MKYRRDISSTLQVLALVLFLFIGYQVWLKPTYLTLDPALRKSSEDPSPQSTSAFTLPETQATLFRDIPQTRLIDPGPAPTRTLGVIRDEVEMGNYGEAERRLMALSNKKLDKVRAKRYAAALWNNLGIQQEKFGGTALSVKAFKKAVALDAASPLAHLNLTQAYWELRDPAMTPRFLERVIRLAPADPFPRLALAELLLEKGNVTLAMTHLDHARPQVQDDPNLLPYLKKLLAKTEAVTAPTNEMVTRTPSPDSIGHDKIAVPASTQVQKPPLAASLPPPTVPHREDRPQPSAPKSTEHFLVRFDGPEDQPTWTRVRAILEYAYQEIPQKFGHVPTNPIAVVLHTGQKFADSAGTPHGADTLFDHASGTIHVPVQGALDDLALFSRVVRHQFVHALLHGETRKGNAAVPTWLVEGLAIYLAEDPWPETEEVRQKGTPRMKLPSLQRGWTQLPPESLSSAYAAASSATQVLIDSYGIHNVRQAFDLLRMGQSLDTAMKQKFSLTFEQFQQQLESQNSSRGVNAS